MPEMKNTKKGGRQGQKALEVTNEEELLRPEKRNPIPEGKRVGNHFREASRGKKNKKKGSFGYANRATGVSSPLA